MRPHILRRRSVVIPAAVLATASLISGGWGLALAFESPAQREANAAPPTPKPITATVKQGDLRDTVSFRATARRQQSAAVPLPPQPGEQAVVTSAPVDVGTDIGAGGVVTEINGRPVFALPGNFTFYRDLTVGDSGPDVRQLQAGLAAAGFRQQGDGVFGASTERAVRALYARAGYAPPTVTDATADAPAAADDGHAAAEPDTGTNAPPPPTPPALTLPRAELLVLATTPATVAAAPPVGTAVTAETTVTVDWGTPRLASPVPARTAERLTSETTGTFTGADGAALDVRVDTVTPAPDDDTADSAVTLTGTSGDVDPSLLGKEGTVILDLQVVARDSLLVPTIAVTPGGSGPAHLRVRQADGSFRRIAVTEVAELRGRSAVRPADADDLQAGDVVRVG